MCNTSVFQLNRTFNKVAKQLNMELGGWFQLSPRKFEVIFNTPNDVLFGKTFVYHFYFGDDEIKYKRIN